MMPSLTDEERASVLASFPEREREFTMQIRRAEQEFHAAAQTPARGMENLLAKLKPIAALLLALLGASVLGLILIGLTAFYVVSHR